MKTINFINKTGVVPLGRTNKQGKVHMKESFPQSDGVKSQSGFRRGNSNQAKRLNTFNFGKNMAIRR